MGEKQIVTGGPGAPGGGTTGGGTTGGGAGPGGLSTTPSGGGGSVPTQTRPPGTPATASDADLCSEIRKKQAALLEELDGVARANRSAVERAMTSFFGTSATKYADGYAHWYTQAHITEALVDGENAVGKELIDAALFAVGGWGGLGELGLAGDTAAYAKYFGVAAEEATGVAKAAETATHLLGKGIAGTKDAAEAYGKIAVKVAEKVGDNLAGYKAGKAGSSLAKSIEKAHGEHPDEWVQGPFGLLESVARGKLIDALGDWMKTGAAEGDLGRAKQAYVDFAAAAQTANVAAATAHGLKAQLDALNAEARQRGCPEVAIPDYQIYTVDPAVFGAGPSVKEKGPTMTREKLSDGTTTTFDLFGSVGDPSSLPGMR